MFQFYSSLKILVYWNLGFAKFKYNIFSHILFYLANIKILKILDNCVVSKKLISEEIEEVVDELLWGHPETRKAAAIKLGRIRDKEVIPHLIKAMLEDEYMYTRVSAIQSLSWIADPVIVEPLIKVIIKDNEELVRKTAINTLGGLRDKKALDQLNNIVNSSGESDDLRNSASLAIEKINGTTAN